MPTSDSEDISIVYSNVKSKKKGRGIHEKKKEERERKKEKKKERRLVRHLLSFYFEQGSNLTLIDPSAEGVSLKGSSRPQRCD